MIKKPKRNPTATPRKGVAENSKRGKTERKSSPEPDFQSLNNALRFERPPAPLVVRKARKALG